MRSEPLPLIGEFYADETRPWSQQDICNWLPCASESPGTRTQVMAKTPPGLSPFAEALNVGLSPAPPVRGVYNAEGRLFTAIGSTLYQVSTAGVLTALGTVNGTGRVRFAHNQITGGNQVLVVNGSAGYVWNTVTSALTQITDDGYPGAFDAVFIDGYLIQIEPARRYAFHSDLADALAYNTLDRFTSEVSPDLLVGLAVNNNELILFSESTAEFFENTGASQQPFRSKRISLQKGCAGRYTIANLDNTVLWLGDDGVFYRLEGYSPVRISTHPIEQAIIGLDWTKAFAFVWESKGRSVCYWTFPDGRTWGYDASQPAGFQWHRRESYGLNRWRVNGTAYWNKKWIASDFQRGRLWELDWGYPLEGDQEFISEVVGPVIHDHQNLVVMPRLELIMDVGPLVAPREFPPQPPPDQPDIPFVYFIGGVPTNNSQLAYALMNPNSGEVTTVADVAVANYFGLHEGGVGTNGEDRVFAVGFTADTTINAYSVVGSALTAAGDHAVTGRMHGLATNGDRVYVLQRDAVLTLLALDYDGSDFTVAGSIEVSDEPGSFNHNVMMHGAFVMAFADNTTDPRILKAYSVAGAVFTLAGSLEVHLDEPAQPGMWSDGSFLYLDIEGTGDKVSVYTFDGATFTEVTSVADPTALTNGVMGGNSRVIVRRVQAVSPFDRQLDIAVFTGTVISPISRSIVVPDFCPWMYEATDSYLLAPGGVDPEQVTKSGFYDLSLSFDPVIWGENTTPLVIPDDAPPVISTITVSGAQPECSGVSIYLDITHNYPDDLLITITEPGGQIFTLFNPGDEVPPDVNETIAAQFPLPATMNGVWTLTLTDNAALDEGTLNAWQVVQIPAVINNRFVLHIDGEAVDEELEAGFIRVCPELT